MSAPDVAVLSSCVCIALSSCVGAALSPDVGAGCCAGGVWTACCVWSGFMRLTSFFGGRFSLLLQLGCQFQIVFAVETERAGFERNDHLRNRAAQTSFRLPADQ